MTSGQKIAFSLLASIALFAGIVLGLNTTLFNQLESRFYTQSKIEQNSGQLNKISESCDAYISEILTQIETGEKAWVKDSSVRSYYVQNPSESDVNKRRQLTEELFAKIPALDGIRIIDKNGRNLHYSSFDDTDVLKQTGITKVYKNYPDVQKDADEIEFELLSKKFSGLKPTILFDDARNRLIIGAPFNWVDGVYAGQAIFYFNMIGVQKALTRRNALQLGENLTLYSNSDFDGGLILNLPAGERQSFKEPVLKYWKSREGLASKSDAPEKLLQTENGTFWMILSSTKDAAVKISGLYSSDIFELSDEIKLLIYICIFITIFLFCFLIFSLKRDPMVLLKKRIKKIQYAIIKDCVDSEDKLEWNQVAKKIKSRRNDFTLEILKSLNVHNKKKKKELEEFLDQNWNEIFSIFDDKAAGQTGGSGVSQNSQAPVQQFSGAANLTDASLEEIRRVLEEVLQNTKIKAEVDSEGRGSSEVRGKRKEEVSAVDDVEDVEELDDVEEIEDAEAVDEIDDVEEIADEEEVSDVEEISDAEKVEDIEEIEEAEEVEDIEDLDEVEEIEDAESAEELDSVEIVEEPEEIEVIDDVEELGDDDLELLEEADDTDDYAEIADIKALDKPPAAPAAGGINALSFLLNQPEYVYRPANTDYFASDDFANVDNVGAEEMTIGPEISRITKIDEVENPIKVYPLPENIKEEEFDNQAVEELLEDIEELTDEVPLTKEQTFNAMTGFGENLTEETPILEGADVPEGAIVESEGVFSISDILDTKDVKQDKDFKALVDSIL